MRPGFGGCGNNISFSPVLLLELIMQIRITLGYKGNWQICMFWLRNGISYVEFIKFQALTANLYSPPFLPILLFSLPFSHVAASVLLQNFRHLGKEN